MDSAVKQRLVHFIKSMHLTQKAFEDRCKMSNGYVANIRKSIGDDKLLNIVQQFPQLNREWLLYGEGEMLKSTTGHVTQNNVNGDNNYNSGGTMNNNCPTCGRLHDIEEVTVEEIRKPIIPTEWTYQPNVDIFEEVKNNMHKVAKSRFVALGIPIDIWHIARDNSLAPRAYAGDYLGLSTYPQGFEDPIWGKYHAVDTKTNGIIVRMLYPTEGGYRGEAPDREKFPDMIIKYENVISISRVVCVVRIAL